VLHGDAPDEVYGILARHFAEAEDARRAIDYLLNAGDAARALYADEDALDNYRRALDFLGETGDEARARETLFKIALTHHLAFDFERANQAYERAFALRPTESMQLEPTERLDVSFRRPGAVAPGYSYEFFASWLVQNLFRGLLKVDREFNVVPELAEDRPHLGRRTGVYLPSRAGPALERRRCPDGRRLRPRPRGTAAAGAAHDRRPRGHRERRRA